MDPFAIHCTTCKARLLVKDEAVIGDILACPKCHSMVQVVPPPGWSRGGAHSAPAGADTPGPSSRSNTPTPTASPPRAATPTPEISPAEVKAAPVPPALPARTARPAPPSIPVTASAADSTVPASALVTAAAAVAPTPASAEVATPPERPQVSATSAGLLARIMAWAKREWLLVSGAGAGVALGSLVWLIVAWQFSEPTVNEVAAATPAETEIVRETTTPADPIAETAPATATTDPESAPAEPAPNTSAAAADAAPTTKATPQAETPADTKAPEAAASPAPADATAAPAAPIEKPKPAGPAFKLDPAATSGANPVTVGTDEPNDVQPSAADKPAVEPAPAAEPKDAEPADPNSSPGDPAPLDQEEIVRRASVALAAVEFNKVPLVQFAEFISQAAGVPVVLDAAGLAKAGQHRRSLVSVKLGSTTAGAALQSALKPLGLAAKIRDGQIVISAK